MEYDSCLIYLFLIKILNYEEGIYEIIRNNIMFIFNTKKDIKFAVDLWCKHRPQAMKLYNHYGTPAVLPV